MQRWTLTAPDCGWREPLRLRLQEDRTPAMQTPSRPWGFTLELDRADILTPPQLPFAGSFTTPEALLMRLRSRDMPGVRWQWSS